MARTILKISNIVRQDLRNNPRVFFLFGDNLVKRGFGGQAKEMRGEPNAIGVPTKKLPTLDNTSFFSDDDFRTVSLIISGILEAIPTDATVVIPAAGLGTGRAQLQKHAPRIFDYLQNRLAEL